MCRSGGGARGVWCSRPPAGPGRTAAAPGRCRWSLALRLAQQALDHVGQRLDQVGVVDQVAAHHHVEGQQVALGVPGPRLGLGPVQRAHAHAVDAVELVELDVELQVPHRLLAHVGEHERPGRLTAARRRHVQRYARQPAPRSQLQHALAREGTLTRQGGHPVRAHDVSFPYDLACVVLFCGARVQDFFVLYLQLPYLDLSLISGFVCATELKRMYHPADSVDGHPFDWQFRL
ncbi:aminofutalosine synthase MqnE [Babesia caballi]|uniref:Aminofutalosine synthase MqnE n=1 Tax=Babesia caballi TaxID=5871 RepID=A0AAV4LTQ5_BABCB|nr:aminofutalosine synthase MqnE [Babesia caballi]